MKVAKETNDHITLDLTIEEAAILWHIMNANTGNTFRTYLQARSISENLVTKTKNNFWYDLEAITHVRNEARRLEGYPSPIIPEDKKSNTKTKKQLTILPHVTRKIRIGKNLD